MTNTKFVVKVDRDGTRAPEYVLRIDRTPVQMTLNRKLALVMGRFTAEDAVKSIQTSRRSLPAARSITEAQQTVPSAPDRHVPNSYYSRVELQAAGSRFCNSRFQQQL